MTETNTDIMKYVKNERKNIIHTQIKTYRDTYNTNTNINKGRENNQITTTYNKKEMHNKKENKEITTELKTCIHKYEIQNDLK